VTDAPSEVATGHGGVDDADAWLPPPFDTYDADPVPQAPAAGPGKDGLLEATLATDASGRTYLARDFVRVPFHHTGLLRRDGPPTLCLQSPTGGIAQGDRHRLSVTTRAGAHVRVTAGAATKVMEMERNYGSSRARVVAGPDSTVEWCPKPTIVHADARYLQDVVADVHPTATALLWDVVVPGRLARGERFDFERVVSRTVVRRDGDVRCRDATDLRGDEGDRPGLLGDRSVVAAAYAIPPAEADGEELADRLHAVVADRPDVDGGASTLPDDAGAFVRVLADRAPDAVGALEAVRRAFPGVAD
jgi:urease accessory protein